MGRGQRLPERCVSAASRCKRGWEAARRCNPTCLDTATVAYQFISFHSRTAMPGSFGCSRHPPCARQVTFTGSRSSTHQAHRSKQQQGTTSSAPTCASQATSTGSRSSTRRPRGVSACRVRETTSHKPFKHGGIGGCRAASATSLQPAAQQGHRQQVPRPHLQQPLPLLAAARAGQGAGGARPRALCPVGRVPARHPRLAQAVVAHAQQHVGMGLIHAHAVQLHEPAKEAAGVQHA